MRLELDAADLATLADMVAAKVLAAIAPSKPCGRPYSARQAAGLLGISEPTVRAMIARGKVARVPGTARILIPESEMDRLLGKC